jgi:drug/metabolite transporter (DMT)-like permease
VSAAVVGAPLAAVVWRFESAAWPYAAASAVLELAYFALLAAAYRRAELSLVYPLARGLAPVFVLLGAIAFTTADTSAEQVLGVALVAIGVLLVRGLRGGDRVGVVFGLAIAACIAGYTVVDKHGVEHATPIAYLEVIALANALAYVPFVAALRGTAAVRAAVSARAIGAGVATFTSYVLVLAALQRAPAASVAAVRETSVLMATALAAIVLHERVTAARYAGAVLVVVGIALLAVS